MGPLLDGKAEIVPEGVAWGGEIFLEHKGTWGASKSSPLPVLPIKFY